LLDLSLYFKQHRPEYYRLLDLVRTEGDWEAWLDSFRKVLKTPRRIQFEPRRVLYVCSKRTRAFKLVLPPKTKPALLYSKEGR